MTDATTPSETVSLDDLDVDGLSVAPNHELKEHEVYLDLANPGHGPFRALAGQTAGTGNRYVAEVDVPHETWHLLIKRDAEAAPVHLGDESQG